jgi:hypothetical protein
MPLRLVLLARSSVMTFLTEAQRHGGQVFHAVAAREQRGRLGRDSFSSLLFSSLLFSSLLFSSLCLEQGSSARTTRAFP